MLEKIKLALRMDLSVLDGDIQDTIDAAKADLKLCGILEGKIVDNDPLIIRAVKTYCKYEFSSDDKESAKYKEAYEMLRDHLALSIDYTVEVTV